jgi:hypothetical protein
MKNGHPSVPAARQIRKCLLPLPGQGGARMTGCRLEDVEVEGDPVDNRGAQSCSSRSSPNAKNVPTSPSAPGIKSAGLYVWSPDARPEVTTHVSDEGPGVGAWPSGLPGRAGRARCPGASSRGHMWAPGLIYPRRLTVRKPAERSVFYLDVSLDIPFCPVCLFRLGRGTREMFAG